MPDPLTFTLRLTADDAAALDLVQQPGESRSDAVRRCIRDAVPPLEWEVWARKGPLFPTMASRGVFSLTRAEAMGTWLLGAGWKVEVRRVQARPRRAEDVPVEVGECEECDEVGGHLEGCSRDDVDGGE